ncbi:MAG TPA: DUF2845 domain-containing protein [Dyella sp.]|uniref:DUF2845 domain-containing protein n=1 Tax=Dyella sp. TaxID=1869338 RepID=UPI002CE092D1|nr:DUF2845 domain-containing protein [Dyella sp.]HTV86630.1 DUF2845 domain-containing protein [Dyella sp.]
MPRYLPLVILLLSTVVQAATSLRVGNKVLTIGDSAVRVQELLGPPAMRTFLAQETGGMPKNQMGPGEQWQYAREGSTVVITIVGGKVANIDTLYH